MQLTNVILVHQVLNALNAKLASCYTQRINNVKLIAAHLIREGQTSILANPVTSTNLKTKTTLSIVLLLYVVRAKKSTITVLAPIAVNMRFLVTRQ